MAAITETPHVRLLRPLLDVPKAALRATLTARGQDWIEDPSNANTAFQRVRLRRLMPALAGEGMTSARLAATAGRMGRARVALEQDTARFIARGVMLDPSGWARFDLAALLALPMDIGLRALASLTRTVGGGTYPPRLERLERVLGELRAAPPKRRTFQGCLLLVQADQSVMVCREPAAAAPAQAVSAGQTVYWDRRFTIRLGGAGTAKLGALGTTGYASLDRAARRSRLPRAVIATVPALSDETGVCQVPHLVYHGGRRGGVTIEQVKFVPDHPLSSP
jgi:tRNA(Ile)-lysidine synthase